MNFAHIHLIINHIPLMTIPMALIFLIYASWRKDAGLKKFSLIVLVLTAVTVLPVYLTGEPAEKVIKFSPGVSMDFIHDHEEAAEFSLVVTLIGGALAMASLILSKSEKFNALLTKALFLTCLVAVGSLGYTANLGGRIRHPEAIDSTFQKSIPANLQIERNNDND